MGQRCLNLEYAVTQKPVVVHRTVCICTFIYSSCLYKLFLAQRLLLMESFLSSASHRCRCGPAPSSPALHMPTGVILRESIIPWDEQMLSQQTSGGAGNNRGQISRSRPGVLAGSQYSCSAMEARAEAGGKPGTCQETTGGGRVMD